MFLRITALYEKVLSFLEGSSQGRRFIRVINYRKFAIALVAMGLTTMVLMFNKLDAQTFGEVFTWVVGLYIGGNGVEHLAKRRSVTETVTETKTTSVKPLNQSAESAETKTTNVPVTDPV